MRALLCCALAFFGCGMGGPDGPMGTGGGVATVTASDTTSSTTDACGGACVPPQVCGIGCGTAPGCYTPGGSMHPTPNDCPSCFRDAAKDGQCAIPGLGEAYSCQHGAAPIGGCVGGGPLECCPSPTCSAVSACPVGVVVDCGPGDSVAACCDQGVGRPMVACERTAGILVTGAACDAACGVAGSECASGSMGLVCCSPGPNDPCAQ